MGIDRLKARNKGRLRDISKVFCVSERTRYRIMMEIDARTGNAEVSTKARVNSVTSKWNTMAYATAHSIMVPKTVPELTINSDATSFNVGNDINQKEKVVYIGRRNKGFHLKVGEKTKGSGGMAFFIKPYMTIAASGDVADLVIIVADDKMPKGEVDWHTIDHFGLLPGQRGHLVFSKTRVPDKSFINYTYLKFWFLS